MVTKNIVVVLILLTGSLQGTVLDKVDLQMSGIVINIDKNAPQDAKDATYFFVKAQSLDPVLRQIIERSGGKPVDTIVVKTGGSVVDVITDFSTTTSDSSETTYKDCIGYIANRGGPYQFFCFGSSCQIVDTSKSRKAK